MPDTVVHTDLDLDFVRSQFPAFSAPSLRGQGFFENAGGSYACAQVIDLLAEFYRETKVQPFGLYEASRRGGAAMEAAQTRLASLMGVAPDWVQFGPSTTANAYVLAQAVGETLAPGDAVIVTDQDHEANSGPWRRLAARGVTIREWRMDPDTGHLDPEMLWDLIDDRVRLVAFPHCSNVVAEVNPVAEICQRLRAEGILTCVDGVAHAPHGLPDPGHLGADIYLFSTYKTFGPHQGVMVIDPDLAMRLPNQGHDFNAALVGKRLTPAGPDHAQIAACAGIVAYYEALHAHHFGAGAIPTTPTQQRMRVNALMKAHECALLQRLLDALATRPEFRLLGPGDAACRAPTVALAHATPGRVLASDLAQHGIMAGGGSFYANRAIARLGVAPEHGVLRLSFLHYTTRAELDRLIDALDRIASAAR